VVTADIAIPQVSLIELVRVRCDDVEQIDGQRVYRLRGSLLPLVDLNETFSATGSGGHPDSLNIVVVRADERTFGLVVDEINDTAEIVVKPLGRLLQHATWFAGATIMGDGRVALIIDALGFAEHVGLDRDVEQRGRSTARVTSTDTVEVIETERMLVTRVGTRRFAMPLDIVARLEQFDVNKIEIANNRQAVQYGSEIMPLVRLGDELGVNYDHEAQTLPAIVFTAAGRSVGLLVDEIVDIVDEAFDVTTDDYMSRGVLGSSVINGLVTDLVDIHGVLSSVLPALTNEGAVA
jgi:two-component system chemotaxis sensor kinase CheA